MDDKLLRFFKKINFNLVDSFEDATLSQCIINRKDNSWRIVIKSPEIIPVEAMVNLITLSKDGIDDVPYINIEVEYDSYDDEAILEYVEYLIRKVMDDNPSLNGLDLNSISISNGVAQIKTSSEIERDILNDNKNYIIDKLTEFGIKGIKLDLSIDQNEKDKVKAEIEKDKKNVKIPVVKQVEHEKGKWTPRKKVEYQREGIVQISTIDREENGVNIEAYIFASEFTELTKKDGGIVYLTTLKISDNSSSILAKTFAKDEEEFGKFKSELKDGNWYHFTGTVRDDTFAHDLVFNFNTYEKIDNPTVKRTDDEPFKRAELHSHTMMSQMDGVIDETKLVKQAMAWGMPGIAITDHDGCQSFPHVFNEVTSYNKNKKKELKAKIEENEATLAEIKETGNEEGIKQIEEFIAQLKDELDNYKPFKVGYGVELDMHESYLNVCYNATNAEIENNTFVIFDTETTGFNPGLSDSMIEIGGVKVKDGEVVDRFDELINPGHPIDLTISKLTQIYDEDVKDCDDEATVFKRFMEWVGDLPMVAHNAKFDKNMLDMAAYKCGFGEIKNPIIDTLMLSRVINRDLKRHSLAALGKAYGINTGEADDTEDTSVENEAVATEISEEVATAFKSIKIDDEDVIKVVEEKVTEKLQDVATDTSRDIVKSKNKYYKLITYKKSKTESVKLDVEVEDGIEITNITDTNKLHAGENVITITYTKNMFDYTIDLVVYVGSHHGADVDSENTAYIFNKMLKQIEGIKTLDELNDLGKLEKIAFKNDAKKASSIGELCSYHNYVRPVEEDEVVPEDTVYPFEEFDNHDYVWKFTWCHDDYLQMYENIPAKSFKEHLANLYDGQKHITMIAKTHKGLKNMFKLISFANTNFLDRVPRIPRRLVEELREDLLIGSACLNGEIFNLALTRTEEELKQAMEFYDYIEVQPIENYEHLIKTHAIDNMDDLKLAISKIIKCGEELGKMVVATGDVHNLNPDDLISREIIANQNVPGKGRHPLVRCLQCDAKQNLNKENLAKAIEKASRNGVELKPNEIKVLKYIFALMVFSEIPITAHVLNELYVLDKNNADELALKNNEEDKKYMIDTALRRLQIAGVVNVNYQTATYGLACDFTMTKKPVVGHLPNQYFRTTKDMLDSFSWLEDDELVRRIVITNTAKIIDMLDVIEVVDYPDKPYSPIIEHSQETCRDLVFNMAQSMYGDPLPRNIEERIANEFYGDKILSLVKEHIKDTHPEMSDEDRDLIFSSTLHDVIMSGYDGVVELMKASLKKEAQEMDPNAISYKKNKAGEKELIYDEEAATKQAQAVLGGIIGGGFDVIYLIAQKLVKHSNDRGYLVGSRGSVGSSFVASMMGITECNGLPPHYYCPKCQYSMFTEEDGKPFTFLDSENVETAYLSGFDLPERECPKCGETMIHQGNDMPFATFLGFNADKVPDIDLNFSGDDQPSAHEYTKVLFGTDNVYRAGTIGTVADKTAFGYVQGFFEETLYNQLKTETSLYGVEIPGKDDLKKKGIVKSTCRIPEVERLAVGCTGVKRTTGQHPGGIVVVPGYKDVWDFTPFQYPADDPTQVWRTTHFDYHAIDADLLKLDILGHDDPTVLRMLEEISGMDVTKIDLGDLDTMKIFTGPEVLGVKPEQLRGLVKKDGTKYCPTGTLGIPEFGTAFLLGMLEETKPSTFAELIKISGLSHGTDVWLGNARDLIINNVVPFSKVIGCRDDIMVNLMAWGIPPAKAFKIMEFVRKGKASKEKDTWKEHKAYLAEQGIPDWYIDSCEKIKYMFPKAHATAYVTSAFRIAYFKVHHPIWYYCAYLSIRRDQFDVASMVMGEDAIRAKIDEIDAKGNQASNKEQDTRETLLLCLEMCCRGFYFKNIDIEKSDAKNFVITDDEKGLIIPFRALDGLGESAAESIVKARTQAPFISQEDLQKRGKCPSSAIEKLKELGCLDHLSESNQLSLF